MRHCWGTMTMPHTRSGHDRDRSRNMRTRNRRLGPLVQDPPPPLPGRHHTTTSRKSTHNNTKGSGLNKPPQNPGLDTPTQGHCTRYAALHPNRRGAMPTDRVHDPIRHKLTCGPARKDVHGPDRLGWARPLSPNSWLGPAAAGPDRPSRRRAERAARGADNERATERAAHVARAAYSPGASLARHKARARGAHTTRPGPAAPNSAEDPGLDSKSDQSIHHEVREGLERGLRLALRQRSQGSDRVAGPGARQLARLLQHVMAAQLLDDRGQGLVGG